MSKQYSPKKFLRLTSNKFLAQYFHGKNLLTHINIEKLPETKIDTLYEAWLNLPEEIRNEIEQDFQQIYEMATEGGSKAIMDEANWHKENLAAQFANLESFYDHAFWTFLERPEYWNGATIFHHTDTIPLSHWRKRKNLPQKIPIITKISIRNFEQALGNYFHITQGRGKNCKIDCYKRNDSNYFCAYPEDYSQTSIEWESNSFQRRSHNPAFEIILIYSKREGTLDIYVTGSKKVVPDLQNIFAEIILNETLQEDKNDERIYDLSVFKSRHFQFIYAPDSGIESITIIKFRLKNIIEESRTTLEANSTQQTYNELEKAFITTPKNHFFINQVGIKVIFNANSQLSRKKTYTFDLTWPNSCNLKYDEPSLIIRKMLVDSGIEPRISNPNIELITC